MNQGGGGRDESRAILHMDMDAFYASVEQLDEPRLRGKAVLVGGLSRRSVVAAASYEARPFGVRSAMSMVEALRLCPSAIVKVPRFGRYREVSEAVFAIFRRYTPLVEGLSLDEAFLDVSASRQLFGPAEAIARRIQAEIASELGLGVSAGVASCKFAAKIASDLKKPRGIFVVGADVAAFLAPLPVEKMWGVGEKTAALLRRRGLRSIGDLAALSPEHLRASLGMWGEVVIQLARGIDPREVLPDQGRKSIGVEDTFEDDLRERAALERALLSQAERVTRRLVQQGAWASVVCVKLRYADFARVTRQRRLPLPVADTSAVYRTARELLAAIPDVETRGVRLTGIALRELGHHPTLSLFPELSREREQRLEKSLESLRQRFGSHAVTRASILRDDKARN